MDATDLIANLVSLEKNAATIGNQMSRDFVIEAQDCILRMQRENLELRRENHVLRLRQGSQGEDSSRQDSVSSAMPPFIFHAIATQRSSRASDAGLRSLPSVELSRAI